MEPITIKADEHPETAFTCATGLAQFVQGGEDGEPKQIRLYLYDGKIFDHWYWGKMAFDLSTMKLARNKVPILEDHDTARRIGIGKKASFQGEVILEGTVLKNEEADKILQDYEQGFPFEASLRFDPAKIKIYILKENESTKVNGQVLKGPGVVLTNTVIKEGSVTVFGAASNTRTETFSDFMNLKENKTMAKQTPESTKPATATEPEPQTVQSEPTPAEAKPTEAGTMYDGKQLEIARMLSFAAGKAEGNELGYRAGMEAERKRLKEIEALALPGQDELKAKFIEDGTPASEAAVQFLAAAKTERQAQLKTMRTEAGATTLTQDVTPESFTDAGKKKPVAASEADLRETFAKLPDHKEFLVLHDGDEEAAFKAFQAFVKNQASVRGVPKVK